MNDKVGIGGKGIATALDGAAAANSSRAAASSLFFRQPPPPPPSDEEVARIARKLGAPIPINPT